MKRLILCSISCIVLSGMGWLAHSVWGQAAEGKERSITYTESQWKALLDRAIAADREKTGRSGPVTDEQVLRGENWHVAVYNKAAWVVYTGPGQAMFHHWVQPASAPSAKDGTAGADSPPGK